MSQAQFSMTRIGLALILSAGLISSAWGVWPTGAGGNGDDIVTASTVGPSGDVFVVGTFSGEALFGGSVAVNARGTRDIFVARYNAAGNLVWVRRAGGNQADRATGIVVDGAGNVYITGSFINAADFGSIEVSSASLEDDIFVAKLDDAGDWRWVRTATEDGMDLSAGIGLIEGNPTSIPPTPDILLIGGLYQCGARFTSPAVGANDAKNILLGSTSCPVGPPADQHYLAALDSDGVWQWASNAGVNGGVSSAIESLDVRDGRVVVIGRYNGALNLGGSTLPTPPGGGGDEFIVESPWQLSTNTPSTGQNVFYIPNQPGIRASELTLARDFDLTQLEQPKLRFNHRFHLDGCFDLGVLEYSIDSGGNWSRVPGGWFEAGGYNGNWNGYENNPLGGEGWCPTSPNWPQYNSVTVGLDSIGGLSSVRFRWRLGEGEVVGIDGWWVDDFSLTDGAEPVFYDDLEPESRQFVARLSNPTSTSPSWSWARPVEPEFPMEEVHVGEQGATYVAGRVQGGFTPYGYSQPIATVGAAAARLDPNNGNTLWIEVADGGRATSLVTIGDSVYYAGHFSGTAVFKDGPDGTLQSAGQRDLFVAKVNEGGTTEWVTGGDRYNAQTGVPGQAGGVGDSVMTSLATDGLANLYVAGGFTDSIVFGKEAELLSATGRNGFVANLDLFGAWFEVKTWLVGEAVTPPANADTADQSAAPDIYINGERVLDAIGTLFFWAKPAGADEAVLTVLDAIDGVEIHWRVEGEPLESSQRIVFVGRTAWPGEACTPANDSACYQVHIAGAPVELDEAGSGFRYVNQFIPRSQASDAAVNAGVMKGDQPGFTVLMYVEGSTNDPFQHPVEVDVVRTFRPNQAPDYDDNIRWDIGEPIVEPYHNQIGRAGYVVNEDAFYDGVGSDAAYDRESRTGHIIPVNKVRPNRLQDADKEMVIAWYRRNAKGIYWPQRAMHYAPDWPLDPDRIIVASEQGGEVLGQQPLGPQQFPDLRIYQQPLASEPGYNPNATHAFFAPSNTGTGILALFALRADFGINLRDDYTAATDPYVLIKYWSETLGRWAFRTFYVTATGAGFDEFQYGGEAGTAVAPPYPLSLLPGCVDTRAVGQALNEPPPPPFFKDYKNGLWSKSAGAGAILFWYPLQPGFVYDITNNDFPDEAEGQCVPWMARLKDEQGGTDSPNLPLEVKYTFTWPSEPAQLIPGETLLKQKRGLPNIYQQDAVEVVFDEHREDMEAAGGAAPEDTLVQLIDPLNPRFVYLDNLEGLGSKLDPSTGWRIITGDSDGLMKLPVSIRERLRYDPLNKRLIFSGVFDDTIAGEPLLLINIMSFREARQLKVLDGSSEDAAIDSPDACDDSAAPCGWAEAVEALLRLTRNPQGIKTVCVESQINPSNDIRECTLPRSVERGELLAAFDDPQGNGFLQPYKANGVRPALSAGATQSVGWVTLAFNNDPALNPAPVSINIIRVDCLRHPPPPDPVEIFSSYQGQLNVIMPDNIFDEQLTLRHSGDFGGRSDDLEFDWYFQPDQDGTPPFPLPNPDTGQLSGWQRFPVDNPQGAVEITVEGANIQTLSDNWYVARYRGLPVCNNQSEWSLWAGGPGATPLDQRAQLGLGWVKRVIARLNPFEARVQDFHSTPTNTYASMLTQLGERYEGDIPLTSNPEVLNSIGLIEAYTTVMRRAMDLSVNAVPPVDYGPVNKAILNISTRLVDFYALLGNEAYADAQDPTVGLLTSGEFASLAPTVYPFENQLASVLEEELVLLRGRDDSQATTSAPPVYNRLYWNFTTGDGEAAYALNYDINDKNTDGIIDEFDARIQYPQGHGDAWGQYLTAIKTHYGLLRHPFFTWEPTQEAVPVAGVPIQVDFFDERKFAKVAAAKARAGSEIVNLTYRQFYVEDPAAQWQGYKDDNDERAWGLSEWARRAGQGAYFDWVVGNAILPDEDPDPGNFGIQKVDRTTVGELDEIVSNFDSIQQQLDQADRGLNPLGLAKGVVPFDIDPIQVDRYGTTHFEQVYERAMGALENAVKVWDFANELNRMLRFNQDSVDDLAANSRSNERNYKNRLIEIFGYPYADDIGPGGLYPSGYDGPDVYHYLYIDVLEMAGKESGLLAGFDINADVRIDRFDATFKPLGGGVNFFGYDPDQPFWDADCDSSPLGSGCALGSKPEGDDVTVEMVAYDSPAFGFTFGKPPEWTGQRRATGSIQNVLHDMFMARIDLLRAIKQYENLRADLSDLIDTIKATYNLKDSQLQIANDERRTLNQINIAVQTLNSSAKAVKAAGDLAGGLMEAASECIPKNTIAGLAVGGDFFSVGRCSLKAVGIGVNSVTNAIGEGLELAANGTGAAAQDVSQLAALKTQTLDSRLDLFNLRGQFDEMLRREPLLRLEMFQRAEAIQQLYRKYQEELAKGQRITAELVQFRKNGAAAVQEHRYQDMAFRVFRNDALQKYRASFDLAARYAYLAAAAYDYDTNLLGSDSRAGRRFLTDIVRERSLGQILGGEPVPGSRGLADPLGRMAANFDVLKGQMGFTNPQVETNRFSLRSELFRIEDTPEGDDQWRRILENARVDDLWALEEFRRFARPPRPESAGPLPGLVIRFPTTVSFGLNFFHWPLGPGDSTYDASRFSTRIRSVGTWFRDYAGLPLSETPRIYMFPTGADVLRSPSYNDFSTREWQVIDQVLPVPFPIGSQELQNANWLPLADTLSDSFNEIRRYSQFRAHHFSEPFDGSQVAADSRLIGRSVWNREWIVMIPGGSLLADPNEGLDTFINGALIPDTEERDGEGVSDIRIFFTTYSYSGN